jgi:hypothetical protein
LLLLAAFGARAVLALAGKRGGTAGTTLSPGPTDEVRARRILPCGGNVPLLRTPGLTALIHGTPDANPAKIADPEGEDSLLVRTTDVSAVFPWLSDRRPLQIEETGSSRLRPGDLVLTEAGQLIPLDGEIVSGAATVDESTVTGVSTSVFCEAGGRSGVLGRTLVLSGRIIIRVAGGSGRRSRGAGEL